VNNPWNEATLASPIMPELFHIVNRWRANSDLGIRQDQHSSVSAVSLFRLFGRALTAEPVEGDPAHRSF
jgi:hypothetical protein